MSTRDDMLMQIDDAISRLVNGEQTVSVDFTEPDGSRHKVEYSPANVTDLLKLKQHYNLDSGSFNVIDMEIVP